MPQLSRSATDRTAAKPRRAHSYREGSEQPNFRGGDICFRVDDHDAAVRRDDPNVHADPVVDIGGVRMFFIHDPDGTPIEILELPAGVTTTFADMATRRLNRL